MSQARDRRRLALSAAAALSGIALATAGATVRVDQLDLEAERWVTTTLARMSLDERIGQMILPAFESSFVSSDSEVYDRLTALVRDVHVGGFHVFGASRPTPGVMLNPTYSAAALGDPLDAASLLNRLQAIAPVPLLNTGDFEAGVGFRLAGATVFPRNMAFGAAGDEKLVHEAGRIMPSSHAPSGCTLRSRPLST